MKFTNINGWILALLAGATLQAQEQPTPMINPNPAGYSLDWFGFDGRSYFIQISSGLENWEFLPVIRSGEDAMISEGFASPSPELFLRLAWSDIPDGGDPVTADFDGDGIPNGYELNPLLSNPLDSDSAGGDTDNGGLGDGLADGWELYYFGATNIADPNAVFEADGLTNKEKSELGLDPNVDYSAPAATQSAKYTYDLTGRLTSVSGSLSTATITYDSEGNILTKI